MGIHYNTKRKIIKAHSSSFYLSCELLKKLDFVAEMKGQSRSVIVDVSLNCTKGENNECELASIERKFFKKRAKKPTKKAKTLCVAWKNAKDVEKTDEQERLFTSADLANV